MDYVASYYELVQIYFDRAIIGTVDMFTHNWSTYWTQMQHERVFNNLIFSTRANLAITHNNWKQRLIYGCQVTGNPDALEQMLQQPHCFPHC